ncbi:MAG: ATP-binding cassette domain-containing protein [Cyclobacteriaceae bacterium]|nr:ATP-binding cassette domain-containing protein [Cyclobacteriaceae bacterium]
MSERLLKAIIQLFAIVAKEDNVTKTERDQIEAFLKDHLSDKAVPGHLKQFDEYSESISVGPDTDIHEEQKNIENLCSQINLELTQKQKIVIILELIGIIEADGEISTREEELLNSIAKAFNISNDEVNLIKLFVNSRSTERLTSENFLVIDHDHSEVKKPYNHILRHGLDGFITIIHLDSSDSYFIRYLGSTELYLNGVPLKPNKILVFAAGSTIRSDRMDPVYFGDIISQFIKTGDEPRVTFEAINISYKFPNGKLGLREVTVIEESGGMIGLMGASGAGKSTLLNVLNGSDKPSSGKVLINGIDIHRDKKKIEGVIGFVPQDDLLIEDLTVYQNLFYSAKLCFTDLSEEKLNNLVIKTLQSLGLIESKDLKVGSPLQKTISGGQRKRLNIGLELLREPSVLFVDEPTSGLSSRDSENIMDLLKELSLKGKLIFVVIHQPSSDIFKMFDKLVILDTGGYQIYYGNPVEAVVYFKNIINMINSEHGECNQCGNVNPEQIFNIIETKVVNEYGNFTDERKVSPEQWNKQFKKRTQISEVETSTEQPPISLRIPGRMKQIRIFSLRDVLSKLSNKQYLFINLLEAPILAFVLAYIVRYYNVDNTVDVGYIFGKNINLPAYLFMSVIVALFMGLTVSAEEIIRDRKILKRESFLNLSRMSYVMSKISILFVLSGIQTITFVLIGNFVLDINDMLFTHWLILFSTSCMANVLGLNISSAFNSAVTIYILIPILLIPQLLLSGVVVKFDKLNPDLTTTGKVPVIGEVMASRWAFEAAMVSQFKDNPFESKFFKYDKVMATADYKRIYYLPELESKLDYCYTHLGTTAPAEVKIMVNSLKLLKNELTKELSGFPNVKFEELNKLSLDYFNKEIRDQTFKVIEVLRKVYSTRYQKASEEKDQIMSNETNTPEKQHAFLELKNHHHNETIADLVKNSGEQHRIIESNGNLFQKIYPIYQDPQPKGVFDFRTAFYLPKKHFMGNYYDTFNFNMAIIWIMTLILIITLYFDVLRNIIEWFEGFLIKTKR